MGELAILEELAIIFAVSLLVILVFHRIRLPALPGFIVAGAVVGPNGFRLVNDPHRVETLAELGVILLLFTVGIEFSFKRLREVGRQAVLCGLVQMGGTLAVTAVLVLAAGWPWRVAVFLGLLAGLSSTAIVLKILTDRGEIDAPHGRLATGVLIFQDLCVVPIMLVLPFLAGRAGGGAAGLAVALGKAALVVVGVIVVARTLVPRALAVILSTRSRELFLIAIILLGTLTALGTAAAGASLALGAFLAGLVISESDYGHQAMAELLPFRDVFISLFFVAVGMLVRFDFLRAHPVVTVGVVALVMTGKAAIAALGPALMGYAARVAVLAGLAVAQVGEFAFVVAREGRDAGLLDGALYQGFLAVAVATMLLTPFVLQGGPALLDRLGGVGMLDRFLPGPQAESLQPATAPVRDHVVIAGYGLNGRNLAAALRTIGVPHLIVELNSQAVRDARARGEPAFYGDAAREEILRALGLERARLLVVAISDPAATRRIVRVARGLNARLHIIARTRYVVEIPELSRLGADDVIPEEFETSIEIFSRVLTQYGVPRTEVARLVDQVRAEHYHALRDPSPVSALHAVGTAELPQMRVDRVRLSSLAPAVGRTLAETGLRTQTGALVLSIRRGENDIPTPDPRFRLAAGDELAVIGHPTQLAAARRLLAGEPASSA